VLDARVDDPPAPGVVVRDRAPGPVVVRPGTMAAMSDLGPQDRATLRTALLALHPWLRQTDVGPQSVSAGECDVCGDEARLVQPCGPPPAAIGGAATPDWAMGRRCAAAAGVEGWCDGHADEATAALSWLRELPEDADLVARLWWVATGEVRADPSVRARATAVVGQLDR
jgi:hypothetical protein